MTRPIGIDLFAGAGGLSLGFEQAGFDVVAAVEIDPVHAAVHAFNFPNCAVIPRSVTDLSGDQIREAAGVGSSKIDVVFGGAPCQGFSLMGQRAIDDPRNSLVKDFVRIVRELDASYFVFENVKGLTLGKHRKFLEELIEEFEAAGYDVVKDWKVLNAYSYGVPQDRQRLFLMGAKRGLTVPKYPAPLTAKPGSKDATLPYGPTCKDALDDLPDAERFSDLNVIDEVRVKKFGKASAYAELMRCETADGWAFGYKREWDPLLMTSSMRSNHSDISRGRFAETTPGDVEPISRFLKLPPKGVSNTLRAGTDSARGAFTSPRPIHYKWDRCVTVREMARLHGFPDWFRFNETKWHGARQIGNSVPPPLARAVAKQVKEAIGIEVKRPSKRVKLGDAALLRLSLAQAAKLWGIASPIGQRDRKSGAKKSKQAGGDPRQLAMAVSR
ncbi:DNA cytosine methyltransferase [Stenotrophomonas aracearum]|jgi:DNA (cytosine-5)-methyltransferase 1|uniref:Cytosine-specific methyltransferase n=1 Tax=Stenotrophomonas aracearum TaxID=3003272 RepID=A0ABY9YEZ7_9GAMM|nr:DNA cytosine methyltransferase [Stenotrophomonas sp. A5588]WNH49186.1 DNA cytosine methyltransferase [Stenotrophomonas sp. A5588]